MRRRRSKILTGAAILGVALLATGCAGGSGAAGPSVASPSAEGPSDGLEQMEPITLTLTEIVGGTTRDGAAAQALMDYVEENSDGKITFEPYWAGALLPGSEVAQGIKYGIADIGRMVVAHAPGAFPASSWITPMGAVVPNSYPTSDIVGVPAHSSMYSDTALPFYSEFEAAGLYPILLNSATSQDMLCAKEITSPEDLHGLTVRVPGAPFQGEVEALGMTTVSLGQPELYEAMQRGVVDCVVSSPTSFFQLDLFPLAKSYLPLGLSTLMGSGYVINKEIWDGLPAEAQQILREGATIFAIESVRGQAEQQQGLTAALEEVGAKIVDTTDFIPIVEKQQEKVLAALPSAAPASVPDAQKSMDHYQGLIDDLSVKLAALGVKEIKDYSSASWATAFDTGADQIDWDGFRELLLSFTQ